LARVSRARCRALLTEAVEPPSSVAASVAAQPSTSHTQRGALAWRQHLNGGDKSELHSLAWNPSAIVWFTLPGCWLLRRLAYPFAQRLPIVQTEHPPPRLRPPNSPSSPSGPRRRARRRRRRPSRCWSIPYSATAGRLLQFVEQQRIRPLGAGIALADSDLLERNRRLMQRLRFARHVCAARRYDRDDR
jgi:hypothetical protein